jgi:hypothetical protein
MPPTFTAENPTNNYRARAGGKEIFLAGEKRERKICERSELRAPKALHNENEEEEEECSLAIMM